MPHDTVPPSTKGAAFFDVDNTLMRGASIYHFARGLASRDLFTTRDLLRFAWGQTVFRVTGASSPSTSTPPGRPRSPSSRATG